MALADIFPKGTIRLLSVTEPDTGALKAATMWSQPEVAFKNLEDAGKPTEHCEVHHN